MVTKIRKIKSIHYVGKINYVALLAQDILRMHAENSSALMGERIEGTLSLLRDNPDFIVDDQPEALEKIVGKIIDYSRNQVARYRDWVMNQALVSFCSYFDAFLDDTLDTIFQVQVDLLFDSKPAKSVELKDVVEMGCEDLISEIRRKEVTRFSFKGIDKRLGYFESKLGISASSLFDWSSYKDPERFEGWDLEKLKEVYDKRHAVVHRDDYPISSIEEITELSMFLMRIIMNLSNRCMFQYSLSLE